MKNYYSFVTMHYEKLLFVCNDALWKTIYYSCVTVHYEELAIYYSGFTMKNYYSFVVMHYEKLAIYYSGL